MSQSANKSKKILAIGAHPDDIEFGCGGTMALLHSQGHELYFAVATDGNRGSRQHEFEKEILVASRKQEQQAAAKILGASEVVFLDQEDGNLVPDLQFKEQIVRLVRRIQPDMIYTHDPNWYYKIDSHGHAVVNHNDHRACGIAVLDTVYPLARDLQSFPEHAAEGLLPHITPELYLWNFDQPGYAFDITDHLQTKIDSIAAHKSQIDDPKAMAKHLTSIHERLGKSANLKMAETFIQLIFK